MKKLSILQTVTQILFLIVAAIVSILITLGTTFDLSKLARWNYWVEILGRMVVSLIIFNVVFEMDQRNRRRIQNSNYYATIATTKLKIQRIFDERLFAELDKAVEEENQMRFEEAATAMLHRVTARVSYKDIDFGRLDDAYVDDLCRKLLMDGRRKRRLKKRLTKIANGRVKYEEVTADEILRDEEVEKDGHVSMHVNYKHLAVKRNVSKAITFLITSVVIAVIGFSFYNPNFWPLLAANATLFLGSMTSGFMQSIGHTRLRTEVFQRRNEFLVRRLNINDKYEHKAGE